MKINLGDKRKTTFYVIGIALLVVMVLVIWAFVTYTKQLQNFANETSLQKNNASEVLKNALDFKQEEIESANSKIGKKVEEMKEDKDESEVGKKTSYNEENIKENEITVNESKKEIAEVIQDDVQDPVFLMPIENGEIIRKFAKDSLVYSETLEEWVTHLGIDIKADMATVVKSSASGTVKDINNDPRYGLSVIVEHTNGYKTVYANLLTAEFVEVGENLEQGQTIGTVGNTSSFEIADPAHLHFEIIKDDENVDPEIYLKQ